MPSDKEAAIQDREEHTSRRMKTPSRQGRLRSESKTLIRLTKKAPLGQGRHLSDREDTTRTGKASDRLGRHHSDREDTIRTGKTLFG